MTWEGEGARVRRAAWIICACLLAVSACTSADLSTLSPKRSSEAPFITKQFVPTVSLVPGTGWRAILDVPHSLTLDDGDPPGLRFVTVSAVFDPVSQRVIPLPKDLEAWIVEHPLLETTAPTLVTIGGTQGTQIDAEVVKAPEVPYEMRGRLCPIPGCVGLFVAGVIIDGSVGSRFRLILMDLAGENLMIEIDSPGSEWPTFLARAEAVLDTVRFPAASRD
jgi:hypothetical protein